MKTNKSAETRQGGFTLIEVSIVLVIIGLIIGGALKGQELIENARGKRIAADVNAVQVAVNTYRDRYISLPGDDTEAINNLGVANEGDGDSTIEGNYNATNTDESNLFWRHLRVSNMFPGDGTAAALPVNAFGGIIGVQDSPQGLAGPAICMSQIPRDQARSYDQQRDDGAAATGNIRAAQVNANGAAGTAGATNWNTAGTYVVCTLMD